MKSSIYFVVFLALAVSSGLGLQCYTCDSVASENCNDPYTPGSPGSWISDCGEASNKGNGATHELLHKHFPGVTNTQEKDFVFGSVCFKSVFYNKAGENITFRSCSYLGSKNCDILTKTIEANDGRMEFCDSCDESLCNSGVKFGVSLVFSAILVFLVRLM